nr:uncharacterized protein LOC129474431 [Symphalangus syndactylus]
MAPTLRAPRGAARLFHGRRVGGRGRAGANREHGASWEHELAQLPAACSGEAGRARSFNPSVPGEGGRRREPPLGKHTRCLPEADLHQEGFAGNFRKNRGALQPPLYLLPGVGAPRVRLAARAQLLASPLLAGLPGFPLPPCGDPPVRPTRDLEQASPEAVGSMRVSGLPPLAWAHTSLSVHAGPSPVTLWLIEVGTAGTVPESLERRPEEASGLVQHLGTARSQQRAKEVVIGGLLSTERPFHPGRPETFPSWILRRV